MNFQKKKASYIAIEGCIGVGKTTLTHHLSQRLNGKILLEQVEENPFLSDFYKDPNAYAFKTQLFFLLSRYQQQEQLKQSDLFDRCLISDYFIAKDRIFASINLTGSEFALYEQLYEALCKQVCVPDLIIYLRAPLPIILDRIERRARTYEQKMDPGYLTGITHAYDKFFSEFTACPLLTIDTESFNFPNSEEDVTYVIDALSETFRQRKSNHLIRAGSDQQPQLFR